MCSLAADCSGNVRLQFTRKPEDNIVQMKKLNIRIKVAKGALKLHNLFNGDKLLGKLFASPLTLAQSPSYPLLFLFHSKMSGDAVNNVINDNFDVISKDIIPLVEKSLQRVLRRIASKITENFTYEQVFPL